jgi:hypothetical protein
MPFADYTVETTDEYALIHQFIGLPRLGVTGFSGAIPIQGDSPTLADALVGNGSLEFRFLAEDGLGHLYHPVMPGFTHGAIRTLVNVQVDAGEPESGYVFGLYCYASQPGLISGAGSLYLMGLTAVSETYRIWIAKSTTGLSVAPSILAQTAVDQWALQTTFAIEFKWMTGATMNVLECRQGSTLGNLATVLTYQDNTPLVTNTGQGIWGAAGSSDAMHVFFDETSWLEGLS